MPGIGTGDLDVAADELARSGETATELSAYPIYTLLVIGLAETIQNQSFIETKINRSSRPRSVVHRDQNFLHH